MYLLFSDLFSTALSLFAEQAVQLYLLFSDLFVFAEQVVHLPRAGVRTAGGLHGAHEEGVLPRGAAPEQRSRRPAHNIAGPVFAGVFFRPFFQEEKNCPMEN